MACLPWPLPALAVWAAAWLVFMGLRGALSPLAALLLACAVGVAGSLWAATWWRRSLIALGFPLSAALAGAVALPAWAWLAPLALLLLVYPINAWRDAPLFPTPPGALRGLQAHAALADDQPVLRHRFRRYAAHGVEQRRQFRLADDEDGAQFVVAPQMRVVFDGRAKRRIDQCQCLAHAAKRTFSAHGCAASNRAAGTTENECVRC